MLTSLRWNLHSACTCTQVQVEAVSCPKNSTIILQENCNRTNIARCFGFLHDTNLTSSEIHPCAEKFCANDSSMTVSPPRTGITVNSWRTEAAAFCPRKHTPCEVQQSLLGEWSRNFQWLGPPQSPSSSSCCTCCNGALAALGGAADRGSSSSWSFTSFPYLIDVTTPVLEIKILGGRGERRQFRQEFTLVAPLVAEVPERYLGLLLPHVVTCIHELFCLKTKRCTRTRSRAFLGASATHR